jgi:hypothetical protein
MKKRRREKKERRQAINSAEPEIGGHHIMALS